MTEKELKRAGRGELLEIIYEMKKTEVGLRQKLDYAEKQLADRRIRLDKAGSIAEAALELQNIFEVAQKAADAYLYSLKKADTFTDIPQADAKNNKSRDAILAAAEKEAETMLAETRKTCDEMLAQTDEAITMKWTEFRSQLKMVLGKYPALSQAVEPKKKK